MTNFLEFVEEDIASKKTLFATLPTNTKTNIRKFNEKVDTVSEKYQEYLSAIKKYLEVKSKSFAIPSEKTTENITGVVSNLEQIRFILNPSNTYFEKVGFDTLFYQISNYHDFKFNSLNDIINEFLNKFELAGIFLTKDDFDYTCYVNEFMSAFLSARQNKTENYNQVSEIFEKIYWVNPEIINHLELNFRKLIKKHEKKFIDYMAKLRQNILVENSFTYDDCVNKLRSSYRELDNASKEDISDIIELAKTGVIDINNYFEDSKVRTMTFNNLMIDPIDLNNSDLAAKFYEDLEKLKSNVEEYANFVKFTPLFEDFKKEYTSKATDKIAAAKSLKTIETQISTQESKLDKINRRIFGVKTGFFDKKEPDNKSLKVESVKLADELSVLYKTHEDEYFKNKVISVLNSSFTVTDLLHLYYSYDYFKKRAIKKVFEPNNYEEVMEYSDSFDLFAMNPTNVIIDGVSLYDDNNIARVIVNKYRLVNINITEEDLNSDLNGFLDKIKMALRVKEIEKSASTVEKIWFMAGVAKIEASKNKED